MSLSFRPFRSWWKHLAAGLLAAGLVTSQAVTQSNEPAFNPRPAREDIVLPMPGGYKMVFVRVPVPGKGYWGGRERIFDVGGGKQLPAPFEASPTVRVGGHFQDNPGNL